ncbi:adenylate/guanylate cyclase domain-containing protein [Nocardia sp. alder85J]|uniref:adenylate/guanylate cyclase domain-containing protein n=1 Tax=Nocardia sp. alder85J TaxID=2862949 RepID=UPI001CD3B544|nr:adenylate/guanylate cyclase domain-containing protein [Nocardia sp. alder85J]MCX4096545.1 adenylate/guanylate cyclase domain-containing protein [Nocardia sp. alder85J]
MASAELSKLVQSVVEPALLNGPRRYSRAEVAQRSGVPSEVSRRLWVSLGFAADPDDSAHEYTEADIAAVRNFRSLDTLAAADPRQQQAVVRSLGQSMARLAEWQVDLVVAEITTRLADTLAADPGADREAAAQAATDEVLSRLQALQAYAWRRHLAAALARSIDSDSDHPGGIVRDLAVGFADMVGYTRLTRHLDPEELTELLETFETVGTEAITAHGGWVIKNVGDEVMFAAETAVAGADIALAIQEATRRDGTTPELRVGLAYGDVLQRFGDLYGSTVNIAARLTGVARPGTVLIDDGAAARLAGEQMFALRQLRSVRVRGFSRLRSHVLRRAAR